METLPAATSRVRRARGGRQRAPSGRARLAALKRLADQRQAVVAKIHVSVVDKDRRRAEAAAGHDLLSVGLELVLDSLLGDAGKEFLLVDAGFPADLGQHGILRDVLVAAPIRLEHRG